MKIGKGQTRLSRALLEMAEDLRRVGIMDEEALCKITSRHVGQKAAVIGDSTRNEETD